MDRLSTEWRTDSNSAACRKLPQSAAAIANRRCCSSILVARTQEGISFDLVSLTLRASIFKQSKIVVAHAEPRMATIRFLVRRHRRLPKRRLPRFPALHTRTRLSVDTLKLPATAWLLPNLRGSPMRRSGHPWRSQIRIDDGDDIVESAAGQTKLDHAGEENRSKQTHASVDAVIVGSLDEIDRTERI